MDKVWSVWVKGPLSTMERLGISSFLKNGHEFHLYTYDCPNVPYGVIVHDANEIIPANRVFKLYGTHISFTDHFRYEMMLRHGGWYTDLDVVCLRPLEYSGDYIFLSEHRASPEPCCTNAIFKVPENSDLMRSIISKVSMLPEPRKEDANASILWHGDSVRRGYCDASWVPFYDSIKELHLESKTIFRTLLNGPNPADCINPDRYWNVNEIDVIHFCGFGWMCSGQDKDGTYNPNCLYEHLKTRYL
jgi:hypothetical protein